MAAWVIDYVNWNDPLDVFTKSRGYVYKDDKLVAESQDLGPDMAPLKWSVNDTLDIMYWDVPPGSDDYKKRGKGWKLEACMIDEFLHDMTPVGMDLRLKGLPGLTMARLILETIRDYAFLGKPGGAKRWA